MKKAYILSVLEDFTLYARDRSCTVVIMIMNQTRFYKFIENTNWCCMSFDIIQLIATIS